MKLTEDNVQAVIEKFWHLNASKAPIKEFVSIISPDIFIEVEFMDIKFQGIAEWADHQIGKLCFFDQKFELFSIHTTIEDNIAISKSKGAWHASKWVQNSAYSQKLIADIDHTWTTTVSKASNKVIMLGHVCHSMKYREGFSPKTEPQDFHMDVD